MNKSDHYINQTSIRANILILTGTGRSGTTYMVRLLREVYGFGLSAEPKDVTRMAKRLAALNLEEESEYEEAIEVLCSSLVINHALKKGFITVVDKDLLKSFISRRDTQGLITGLFKYVAHIRGADTNLPAYKDPLALHELKDLIKIFPDAAIINMMRRGEDVAGSTLKFNWGANNIISGAWEWRSTLKDAIRDLELFPNGRVLNVRLEEMESNPNDTSTLFDQFIRREFNIEPKKDFHVELVRTFNRLKKYELRGCKRIIVRKICTNLNNDLGYCVERISKFEERFYLLLAWPFRVWDLLLRGLRKLINS